MSKPFRVSLTFKVLFFVILYVLGIIIMWFISRDDLYTAKVKFKTMELAYLLDNVILEARRYEKNFLLYSTPAALEENSQYITRAEITVGVVYEQMGNLKALPLLKELEQSIYDYHDTIKQLAKVGVDDLPKYEQMISTTRDLGKQMTEKSAQLLEFERTQLHSIFRELENRMNIWSLVAICLGFLIPFLTFFGIFKPLSAIKKATSAIAQGRFKQVEVLNTHDEMQQVMEAFNTMVHELERRQDQLVQSKKLSSLGTLTAGVAHQLNNPLNNISTSCQIALDDFESGDRDLLLNMLNNIDQETLRARDVVKGLLEFSRAQVFKLRPSPLADIVNRAVRLVNSQVPVDVFITVAIPADLILPMDVQRMQEVFLNLIINAAQSIEQQGSITITAEVNESKEIVVIEIHDTGAGIPKEIQGQLFDPFYTTKEEGQGTGLGLSVVYGIIQKHHGEITVSSEPGQGASFFITLPLNKKELSPS